MVNTITIQKKDGTEVLTHGPEKLVELVHEYSQAINIIIESDERIIELTKMKDGNFRVRLEQKGLEGLA